MGPSSTSTATSRQQKWGYFRIIAGTLLGGALGFYIKHRIEVRYKEKMEEKILSYENERRKRDKLQDSSDLISD